MPNLLHDRLPSIADLHAELAQLEGTNWLRRLWRRADPWPHAAVEQPPRRGRGEAERRHTRVLRRALRAAPVPGNRVELLVDGPATHRAMFGAIAAARDHINIESYILEQSGPGVDLQELLLRKCAEGVRINLIYDSFGSWSTPSRYFESLRAAGVALLEFNPVNVLRHPIRSSLHQRDHRKILVVDGRVAFIGGVNISSVYSSAGARKQNRTDSATTAGVHWRDTHMRIEGPVVAELQRLFLDHWRSRSRALPQQAAYFPSLPPAGDQLVAVAACAAGRRRNPIYRSLLGAIRAARSSVHITAAYFVPTRRLMNSLSAAAQRGVDVRLALPGRSDAWAPLAAGRARYGRLLKAGVRVYERHDAILHSKTAVVDGIWATVGSCNMDWRSFLHNAEANVVVVDAQAAARLDQVFLDDVAASRELTLDEWSRRSWTARLGEWLALRMEFLL